MKTSIIAIITTVILLGCSHADLTYWTGIDIKIADNKATVSVSLTASVDSADEGNISLIVQDEAYQPLKIIEAANGRKAVQRGIQSLTLSKTVEIKPKQQKIQVWTPIFPKGETKSTKPVFGEYELKRLEGGKIIAVLATQKK